MDNTNWNRRVRSTAVREFERLIEQWEKSGQFGAINLNARIKDDGKMDRDITLNGRTIRVDS